MIVPLGALATLCLGLGLNAHAEAVTQTIRLENGWNAIHLGVTPADGRPSNLFGGLPVASVWTSLERLSSVGFIQNPDEAVFNEAAWLRWYPPPQPDFLSNLRELQGGRTYLVKLTNGPIDWQITGQPAFGSIQWVPNAWNLRGFPVASENPPTFRDYFRASTNHYDAVQNRPRGVYRLGTGGSWELANPDAPMRAGEACWVFCQGDSSFTGPLSLNLEGRETLDFGTDLERIAVTFENLASGSRTVTMSQLGTAIPGLLAYQRFNLTNGFEWVDVPEPFMFSLAQGSPKPLQLAIRRSRFDGTNYAGALQITDGAGTRLIVPVLAEKAAVATPYAGLWAGTVTVNEVSESHFGTLVTNLYASVGGVATPLGDSSLSVETNRVVSTNTETSLVTTNYLVVARLSDGTRVPIYEKVERSTALPEPKRTQSEFTMRLLIHVDTNGLACLLKEVVQMWREGTITTNAQGQAVVDKPGTYVLLTRDDLLGQFKGATVRNGVSVGRRLSAIGFDFDGQGTNHMALSGAFARGGSLTGVIQIGSDYPMNPFLHKYHPDHDNLDAKFQPMPADGTGSKEAYAITRQLQFGFSTNAPTAGASADPAYSAIAGSYEEILMGLDKRPIRVRGTFQLNRASFIAELNSSPTP